MYNAGSVVISNDSSFVDNAALGGDAGNYWSHTIGPGGPAAGGGLYSSAGSVQIQGETIPFAGRELAIPIVFRGNSATGGMDGNPFLSKQPDGNAQGGGWARA